MSGTSASTAALGRSQCISFTLGVSLILIILFNYNPRYIILLAYTIRPQFYKTWVTQQYLTPAALPTTLCCCFGWFACNSKGKSSDCIHYDTMIQCNNIASCQDVSMVFVLAKKNLNYYYEYKVKTVHPLLDCMRLVCSTSISICNLMQYGYSVIKNNWQVRFI